jgi:hypothetical protein
MQTRPVSARARITIVLVSGKSPHRLWRTATDEGSRVVLVEKIAILHQAIAAMDDFGDYIERIIIDETARVSEALAVLYRLSPGFRGDILIIQPELSSLSVWSGDGSRTIERLRPQDVASYLRGHALTGRPSVQIATGAGVTPAPFFR